MRPPKTERKGVAPVLILLAGLFLAAGMSRLGLGVAVVIAGESDTPPELSDRDTRTETPDPGDLLATLLAREDKIERAEAALAAREEQMRAAEAAIMRQMTELEAAEARLAATLSLTETAAEEDLQRLTSVFENMKPQQAAELFSQMDTDFAAGFISRLRPDFAGEIMAGLDPVLAYAISAVIAGRHARTPRD